MPRYSTQSCAHSFEKTSSSGYQGKSSEERTKPGEKACSAACINQPGSDQLEPVAGRVEEFLCELSEMGDEEREAHLRYAMNPRAESVVLVTGSSKVDRDAVFSGFNTPLLPDILVCTQVGQEGIDFHRHCRHVIHYDLGWNPAAIEQRTGHAGPHRQQGGSGTQYGPEGQRQP